jgi:hypothetical protein
MSLRRSGGFLAALFLLAGLTGCSSKTYRDVNYGSDLGRGWMPEVGEAGTDEDAGETAGSGGASGTGGAVGTGGTGGGDAGVGDDGGDAADALDNG